MTDSNEILDEAESPAAMPLSDEERQAFAVRLVAEAKSAGVQLIGPSGLLADLAKRVIETGLEVEMTEHVGYDKHDPAGRNGGSSRTGTRSKTVITELGPIEIDVPRERDRSFAAITVRKRQRRLNGVDAMVLSLSAKGLTTGEISAHLAEVYEASVSKETISKITDAILDEIVERLIR